MNTQAMFQKINIKETRIRRQILSIFLKTKKPLTAQEIQSHESVKQLKSNKTTVYRTLEIFYKFGIIQRLEFQEGKFRYELKHHHHHHIVCTSCGKIQDISECIDKQKEEQIEKKTGFTIHHHSMEFFGTCSRCKIA